MNKRPVINDAYIDHAIHYYYSKLRGKPKYDEYEHTDIFKYLCKGYPVVERNGEEEVGSIVAVKLKERSLSKLIGVTEE